MPELLIYAMVILTLVLAVWFGTDIWKAWINAKAEVNEERARQGLPLETRWWRM